MSIEDKYRVTAHVCGGESVTDFAATEYRNAVEKFCQLVAALVETPADKASVSLCTIGDGETIVAWAAA